MSFLTLRFLLWRSKYLETPVSQYKFMKFQLWLWMENHKSMYHLGWFFPHPKLPKRSGRLFINLFVSQNYLFQLSMVRWFKQNTQSNKWRPKASWTHKKNNVSLIHLLLPLSIDLVQLLFFPGFASGNHLFLPELLQPFGPQISKFDFRSSDLGNQNHLSSLQFRQFFFTFVYLGWIMLKTSLTFQNQSKYLQVLVPPFKSWRIIACPLRIL